MGFDAARFWARAEYAIASAFFEYGCSDAGSTVNLCATNQSVSRDAIVKMMRKCRMKNATQTRWWRTSLPVFRKGDRELALLLLQQIQNRVDIVLSLTSNLNGRVTLDQGQFLLRSVLCCFGYNHLISLDAQLRK